MLRGLVKLTWLEIKIFLREPMGAVGTIIIPVAMFIVFGRVAGGMFAPGTVGGPATSPGTSAPAALGADGVWVRVILPVFAALLIALSAVISLVTIISIYREGGILKRLRATPLRPATILTAHVVVKLLFTAATLALLVLAGKRYYPSGVSVSVGSAAIALLISTWSVLSLGFIIASLVPTARFAQPIAAAIFYPMVALSGLFVPLASMPPGLRTVARLLPLTYAVSLLKGIWQGDSWFAHAGDVAALVVVFAVCVAISSRVFRWE
ncbi:MAG TPA: ABC transporter permease [Vicinamibacterales bacterium]|nr:ABC transporter permease [Vicinamibacterales bacterium]